MKFAGCVSTIVLFSVWTVPAHGQNLNFADRYILARGNCRTGVTNLITEPFGKPIDEWVDVDLLKMRAALARCHAEASRDDGHHWSIRASPKLTPSIRS